MLKILLMYSPMLSKINSKRFKELYQFYRHIQPLKDDHNNHLIDNDKIAIFGISRGGTTWFADILTKIPESCLVWEPLFKYNKYRINSFNPFAFPEQSMVDFGWTPHIPQDQNWPEAEFFFKQLFNGKILNLKILRFNDLAKVATSKTFIFKFCFGNLLLPWLVDLINFKPIVLVRHPLAVVASMTNFGDNFSFAKNDLAYDFRSKKFSTFYEKYIPLFEHVDSPERRLLIEWIIQYDYLINHPYNNKKWTTVSYEDLYMNPEKKINEIFKELDKPVPSNVFDNLREVSFSSNRNHSVEAIKQNKQLSHWKSKFSATQISNMLKFLELAEIDFYSEKEEPDYKRLYNE